MCGQSKKELYLSRWHTTSTPSPKPFYHHNIPIFGVRNSPRFPLYWHRTSFMKLTWTFDQMHCFMNEAHSVCLCKCVMWWHLCHCIWMKRCLLSIYCMCLWVYGPSANVHVCLCCCFELWKTHLHFSAMSVTHLENSVPADAQTENSVEMTRTGRSSTTSLCFPVFTHRNLTSLVWECTVFCLFPLFMFHQNDHFVLNVTLVNTPYIHQCTQSHEYCTCTQTNAYNIYCNVRFSVQTHKAYKHTNQHTRC